MRANRPVPRSAIVYYFEIKVANKGAEWYFSLNFSPVVRVMEIYFSRMGVGLSEKSVSVNRLPGWEPGMH